MSTVRAQSFHSGGIVRSRSEGSLIDLDDESPINNNSLKGNYVDGTQIGNHLEWPVLQPNVLHGSKNSNPFWNRLLGSNPFLEDIVHTNDSQRTHLPSSILKEDPIAIFGDDTTESISSSSDELDINHLLSFQKNAARQSGRCKSTSDLLDILDVKESPKKSTVPSNQYLTPNFEWLQNDREAYKLAWLSHRQLTRSCLDLGVMSQSPGWAQTQASETHIICKIGHDGGSVQLPDTDISAHIPEGHVLLGETQNISLKAFLDPPQGLNSEHSTIISPLVEVSLSNLNTRECISVEMKIAAEVKNDPLSQVMTEVVCLSAYKKDGPFLSLPNCYIYKNTLQVKLNQLQPFMYIIAAAKAKSIQPPATSVWDYIKKQITIGFYGPKHVHPSFTAVCAIFGHDQIPTKLSISDIKRGNKTLPPVVLQLWGKHQFHLEKLQDLQIMVVPVQADFEIKSSDQIKQIKLVQLKMGRVLHLQFPVSKTCTGEISPFNLNVIVKDLSYNDLAQFIVQTPSVAPKPVSRYQPKWKQRRMEARMSMPIPETTIFRSPKFQERNVSIDHFGIALKSVLRQPKIEYLLEYFKGDTIALLSLDRVKAIGMNKVKNWYIGFLRGKIGLVHCKNIKVISKEQVIDFTDVSLTTTELLNSIVLPFKKLTYIYSSIQTLAVEHIPSWKAFADVLGYSSMSVEAINRTRAQTEAEKVACVLEKLKEDCHSEKGSKKFQHELIIALLKINCHGLVARLTQNTVILSAAVELGSRWRELGEKIAKLTKTQIEGYEAPHRGKNGEVNPDAMWKPAYDFIYTWSAHYGDAYRDVLQDLHLALDKMKSPVTQQWRQLTGVLILVSCMDKLRGDAFPVTDDE
ncbi:metastasis-associated in colon cancer protein 1 [Erpetoichthys calabaricus]|uniref:MET transcriptional regulator MACC1 n=1 Tax=Erpetoichthys calabaricus TaxID=27687 RepID=A0A8C4SK92_ERPCA|nr:metastasis-associated in colon cancer protein 1 [Erpetoichthys calabaricus]